MRILFVCLGNICRSPMAEGVMRHLVAEQGLSRQIEVDSAGTSNYHIGAQPHTGTLKVLREHGIDLQHAARQFKPSDGERFDVLVAMDGDNLADMQQTLGKNGAKIHYLLDFIAAGPRGRGVPDPWYTGDFNEVYRLIEAACRGLLEHIQQEHLDRPQGNR